MANEAETIAIDAFPVGTAAMNAATAGIKLLDDLMAQANSPDNVKAAEARRKLADMDALAVAQQQNNLKAEQLAAENANP